MLLVLLLLLVACGCAEHLDRNGDGRCDKCVARMPEETETTATTAATTTAAPITFASDEEIAAAIGTALENAHLGDRLDIGLTVETAPFYTVKGEDDYVRINQDGTLEIIGIRARSTVLEITGPEGRTVFRDFYSLGGGNFAAALRRALFSEGLITSETADAPASAIKRLTSLSLRAFPVTDAAELSAIRYMTSLSSLDLSGCSLGSLAYLRGLDALEALDISYAIGLDTADGGLAVASVLFELPALRRLSVVGAYSVLNRQLFDTLVTLTVNGKVTLEALEGKELAAAEVDGFAATVFFSIAEYAAHLQRNGVLQPAPGFSHAIFAYSAADHGRDAPITADNLALLELYGKPGYYFCSPVTTTGNLTVNLYDYSLRATRENSRAGIKAEGDLVLVAYGASSIYGGGWDSPEVTYLYPGEGVRANDVSLDAKGGGTLYIEGGRGALGRAGVTDIFAPDDPITQKNGGIGETGADGVYAVCNITVHSSSIKIRGGRGGRGGDGADSSKDPFVNWTGGNGGTGGYGGNAVSCGNIFAGDALSTNGLSSFIYGNLFPGVGGNGGVGGKGYALNKDGVAGSIGGDGLYIAYH